MKKKSPLLKKAATEDDFLVELTFYDFPVALLTEFAEKIVCPCYHGNLNQSLKDLMEKAITEQDFLLNHIEKQIYDEKPV